MCTVGKCDDSALFNPKLGRYIRECENHRDERLDRDAKRRRRKANDSECMACSRPRNGTSVYCDAHKTNHAKRMRSRRTENRDAGMCVECGAAALGDARRCNTHLSQQREYVAKIDRLSPEKRRHYASYCSACGIYRVHDSIFCTVCDTSRLQCTEYRWHEMIRQRATADQLWPASSSTFSEKKAFGTIECHFERLVYADMVWVLMDRVVVLECDEHEHEDRIPECEVARMDAMQFGSDTSLGVKPLVILRFNPHQHGKRLIFSDLDDRVGAMYQDLRFYLTCRPSRLPPLENVKVVYYNFARDNKHVKAARASARFIVQEN
jgi:hypothetical protein